MHDGTCGSGALSGEACRPRKRRPAYAVTYLEMKADAVPAARDALRSYGAARTGRQAISVFTVLEETGRDSRFAILEAWASRAALEQHYRAASAARMLAHWRACALRPMTGASMPRFMRRRQEITPAPFM